MSLDVEKQYTERKFQEFEAAKAAKDASELREKASRLRMWAAGELGKVDGTAEREQAQFRARMHAIF